MNSAIFYCLSVVIIATAYGQKPAPTAPARPPTTSPTTGTTTNPSNTTNPSPTTTTMPPRPIFLSGKVVLQDGTPPPDFVKIERICGGNPRPQGYTDAKGRFSFQVDSQFGYDPDASDSMGRSAVTGSRSTLSPVARGDLTGCDLRAVLPGFISGTISLGSHNSFDNSDVGVIVLRRAGNVDGTTISMTSLNAPKDAQKAYEKGRELLKKEKPEEAERNFQKAVDIYPRFATAWYQLGLLQTHGHLDQAEISFNRSVEADPKFVSPYLSLAVILEQNKRWEKAVEVSDTVIKLNGAEFPQAYFYKAVAQFNLQDEANAEKSVRKAIELDLRHEYPRSEKLLGIILLRKNDLAGGAEHLQKYLDLAPNANDAADVRAQLAEVQKQALAVKQP